MLPPKWAKGDLRIFSLLGRLGMLRRFGYGQIEHLQIFGEIWGNFPISPKIGGRGEESNHGILKLHHTPSSS